MDLHHLNMKLQGKNNLFPNISEWYHCIQVDVKTVHLAITKWRYEPFAVFKGADRMCCWNWQTKCIIKIKLPQDSLEVAFVILLNKKTAFWDLQTHFHLVNN